MVARTPEPPRDGRAMIDGQEAPLSFARTGPGLYEADLPPSPAGSFIRVTLTAADGKMAGAVAVAGRSREDLTTGVDEETISTLVLASSEDGSGLPEAPKDRRRPGEKPVHLPLLLVALGLLPLDVAVRRIGR